MMTEPTLPASTEKASRVRMSPGLARKMGGLGLVTTGSHETQRCPLNEVLPGLEGTAGKVMSLFDGRASLVVGADVSAGPWHYSVAGKIEKFDESKVSRGGKFGTGTYLGVGELAGETIDGLRARNSVRHDVGFTGNMLVVSRDQVNDTAAALRTQQGIPPSAIRTNIQNAPLSDYVSGIRFDGETVDAVMVYMDVEQKTAEIVVLPSATDSMHILHAE